MDKKIFNTAFTIADRRSSRFHISNIQRKAVAFTMAEILLSLTIIGVVAAITLPSLTGNINERTWNTQRKALYARISQAVALMPYVSTYGIGETDTQTRSIAAKVFIMEGLSKVLKINNICDSSHLQDCGISSTYKSTKGTTKTFPLTLAQLHTLLISKSAYQHATVANARDSAYSFPNTNVAAFETANGESVAVFYNPLCRQNIKQDVALQTYIHVAPMMCANFVFDLNGKKGPNTVGKDIGFMTAFYPTDTQVVMPIPLATDSMGTTGNYVNSYDPYNGDTVTGACKLVGEDVRLPNREELASLVINNNLLDFINLSGSSGYYYAATKRWHIYSNHLAWTNMIFGHTVRIRCIKR